MQARATGNSETTDSPKIVLLGGGTGSFTLLQGLKKLTPKLTAIVNMSDDGGSTGVLRDELGVLPPGDVRQCLVALSGTPEVRELFSYRFSSGRFEGQSLGNIILSGLELQTGSFEQAVAVASRVLHITGRVVPVTLQKHNMAVQSGGEVYRGEHLVDSQPLGPDAIVWLEPACRLNPAAAQAIREADLVVLASGSVYTSLIPNLAVDGMSTALRTARAPVVCVANLVDKPHQTNDWHVADYVRKYEEYIGVGTIDTVLYNNQPIDDGLLRRYADEGAFPVRSDAAGFAGLKAQAIGAPLVSAEIAVQDPADKAIRRTLIRHDADAVAGQLAKLLAAPVPDRPEPCRRGAV